MKSFLYALSLALVCGATVAQAGQQRQYVNPPALDDADFYEHDAPPPDRVRLGRLLFFDKILSGNLNISCATCHHPLTGTGDGLSLPVGEGSNGLGVTRDTGVLDDAIHERVPRNAPPVFNLGARQFTRLFHDGRIEPDPLQPSGFASPAGLDLPAGLDNVLAAQAMFPVTSGTEMAGQPGENPQADAAHSGDLPLVWDIIAQKLRAEAAYEPFFIAAYPGEISWSGDITYVHAANAIAAFEASAWRFDNSPYDRYLRHDNRAMSPAALRGMRLFNGKAGCSGCHSGALQTDHGFHAIAMPQIGPGKGHGLDGLDDFGREVVTGDPADRYRFRTPTLRNVSLTAPYGHGGAFATLESVVRHHLDPLASLFAYDLSQARLPDRADLDLVDFALMSDPVRRAGIADANELLPVELEPGEFRDLIEFLHALTDPAALDLSGDVPPKVPSGLPIFD
ncbi:MAG: cytochrome-c peroxidase [Xanthomonadales bacterium]|nr:cytochrome-c peroxidase [Xanthomonadales bacterium]NIX12853.1 cytochrome-c peroxidase [Xanthomonadales bacterium]